LKNFFFEAFCFCGITSFRVYGFAFLSSSAHWLLLLTAAVGCWLMFTHKEYPIMVWSELYVARWHALKSLSWKASSSSSWRLEFCTTFSKIHQANYICVSWRWNWSTKCLRLLFFVALFWRLQKLRSKIEETNFIILNATFGRRIWALLLLDFCWIWIKIGAAFIAVRLTQKTLEGRFLNNHFYYIWILLLFLSST